MKSKNSKSIAVIVAHPDDESLWAGGTILEHPSNDWFIVCLCRGSDCDRTARFKNALKLLNAEGIMGDLDDGPNQEPLDEKEVEKEILRLLPEGHYDLIITHDSKGEYTKHLRHEEVNKAVVTLWHEKKKYLPMNFGPLLTKMEIKPIFLKQSKKLLFSNHFRKIYGYESTI